MSANIPETMPIKDLLKSTGYNCPDALANKTFDEATSGGDVKVESNKAATIDVSQYTEPVVIKPTSGKDAMAKTTVTLSNIPSGADIESNKAASINVSTYTEPVEITPTEGKDGMAKATVTLTNIPSLASATLYAWGYEDGESGNTYLAYTLSATPSVGDKAVVADDAGSLYGRIQGYAILSVTENEIQVNSLGSCTRDSSHDTTIGA